MNPYGTNYNAPYGQGRGYPATNQPGQAPYTQTQQPYNQTNQTGQAPYNQTNQTGQAPYTQTQQPYNQTNQTGQAPYTQTQQPYNQTNQTVQAPYNQTQQYNQEINKNPQNTQTNQQANTQYNQALQTNSSQPNAPQGWTSYYFHQVKPEETSGLKNWFNNVDSDKSGTVEANELQNITFDQRQIGLEVAKKLVLVFDEQRRGNLEFNQYITMHKFIAHMRQAFTTADSDRSGRIDSKEIHVALQKCGFQYISISTIEELMITFDKSFQGLDWPEFLLLVSHIAHCRSVFEWNDKGNTGVVKFNIDELTQISAYLRS